MNLTLTNDEAALLMRILKMDLGDMKQRPARRRTTTGASQ